MRLATILCVFVGAAFAAAMPAAALAFSSGPPDGFAGNPPAVLDCTVCHADFPVNSGNGSLSLADLPPSFVPGVAYDITVVLSDPGQRRWGFELTVVGEDPEVEGGTMVVTDPVNTQLSDSESPTPDYLKHTSAGTRAGTPDGPVSWTFRWVAPDLSSVSFYLAGNAANNDGSPGEDYIYLESYAVPQGPTAATASSWGRVKSLYSE